MKITGVADFVILAETEHEQQWLKALTKEHKKIALSVEYLYPNHEPKDLNNPCIHIGWSNSEKDEIPGFSGTSA